MTNDKEKEEAPNKRKELRDKFEDWFVVNTHLHYLNMNEIDSIFDFFYQEIEAREREYASKIENCHEFYKARITKHVEIHEAAEEVLQCVPVDSTLHRNIYFPGFNEAVKKYQALKEKSNLKE